MSEGAAELLVISELDVNQSYSGTGTHLHEKLQYVADEVKKVNYKCNFALFTTSLLELMVKRSLDQHLADVVIEKVKVLIKSSEAANEYAMLNQLMQSLQFNFPKVTDRGAWNGVHFILLAITAYSARNNAQQTLDLKPLIKT